MVIVAYVAASAVLLSQPDTTVRPVSPITPTMTRALCGPLAKAPHGLAPKAWTAAPQTKSALRKRALVLRTDSTWVVTAKGRAACAAKAEG